MSGPFQRTVVLNVTEFPSAASRVDIAKCIHAKFDSRFPVESIQFVPGGNVQVTFVSSAGKLSVESADSIAVGSVQCRVVRPGPRMENVLVFHYPFESHPSALRRVLSSFGEVHDVSMQHYPDLSTVSTGTRIVRMVRKSRIPRFLDIDGSLVKIWYRGQPVECDICNKSGHVSKDCPLRGKCRRCLQSGHLARNCKNAPRAWGSVQLAASADPTPAEAAAASVPSYVPVPYVPVRPSADDVGEIEYAPAASTDGEVSGMDDASAGEVSGVDDTPASSVVGDDGASVASDVSEVAGVAGENAAAVGSVAGVGENSAAVGPVSAAGVAGAAGGANADASQSVLAEASPVVDPPGEPDRSPVDIDTLRWCYTPYSPNSASFQDGQVVNTPLSDSQVLSAPVDTVIEEGINVRDGVRLIPREFLYRRQQILSVDWRRRKVRVQVGSGSKWVDGIVERRR